MELSSMFSLSFGTNQHQQSGFHGNIILLLLANQLDTNLTRMCFIPLLRDIYM